MVLFTPSLQRWRGKNVTFHVFAHVSFPGCYISWIKTCCHCAEFDQWIVFCGTPLMWCEVCRGYRMCSPCMGLCSTFFLHPQVKQRCIECSLRRRVHFWGYFSKVCMKPYNHDVCGSLGILLPEHSALGGMTVPNVSATALVELLTLPLQGL